MFGKTLRQDILDELDFDSSFDSTNIGIAVHDNVATLTGFVSSYAQKAAVVRAARRVKGIRAIADETSVRRPEDSKTSDDQIAKRALDILNWDSLVPSKSIQITVRNGLITLSGEVEWQYQRSTAEDDIRKLSGVVDVVNSIEIQPRARATDVQSKIEGALRRNAGVEAKAIQVSVGTDGQVYLDGKVHSWEERSAVTRAAWSAPGVAAAHDRLITT